jgi:hypothetical protein
MNDATLEDDSRSWVQASETVRLEAARFREPLERERREQERLKAEQEAIEEKRRLELFVRKSTLPYSDKLAEEICSRVASGELLTIICREDDMPTMRRCNQWLKEFPEFQALMDMSKNDRLNIFEEDVIAIADDMKDDFKTIIKNGKEKRVVDPEVIARAKLRIEVRFRHLKSGKPARWGEACTLSLKTDDPNDVSNLSIDELEKRLAEFYNKTRIFIAA